MAAYEDEILRLNQRIKELLASSEKAITQNNQLFSEKKALKIQCNDYHQKLQELKEKSYHNHFRVKELEDAREKMFDANQKQKISINKAMDTIRKQAEKLKNLENMVKSQSVRMSISRNSMGSRSSVSVTGSDEISLELAGVKRENQELRAENVDLEHKLNEAYNLIDDLEFEMESLDYAEADRDHFEKELRAVRQELANLQSATPKSAFHVHGCEDEDSTATANTEEALTDEEGGFRPMFAAATIDDDGSGGGIDHFGLAPADEPPSLPVVNEQKTRRHELHKRLELLHKQQQKDLPI